MKTTNQKFATFLPITALSFIAALSSIPTLPTQAADRVKPVLPQADVAKVPVPSVIALDATEKVWSLQLTAGSRLVVRKGDVVVNSSSTQGVWNTDSTIEVLKGNLNAIGGYYHMGRAVVSPQPQTLDQPGEDPITPFTVVPPRFVRSNDKLFLQDNSDITLKPGIYNGGIFATGKNLHITLAPGVYVMNNGDFFMSGCTVTGKDVTVVLAGPQAGMFWTAANAQIDLSAPTEGNLKDIVLVSRAKGWNKVQISTTRAHFTGTIYAPEGGVAVLQNSNVSASRIICLNLGITESSFLEVTGDSSPDIAAGATADDPAPVKVLPDNDPAN